MPEKIWSKELPNGFRLHVRRKTHKGALLEFVVALIYENECITRYDNCHGFAHRDVLGRKSALIRKENHSSMTGKEAFEHAIHDLSQNYEACHAFFIAH
jgi:hypothetical protein